MLFYHKPKRDKAEVKINYYRKEKPIMNIKFYLSVEINCNNKIGLSGRRQHTSDHLLGF